MRKFVLLLLVAAAALAALWFAVYRPGPRHAVGRLGAAVATRDTAALLAYADTRGIAEAMAREIEREISAGGGSLVRGLGRSSRDSAAAERVLRGILTGGRTGPNPYLVSLGEQLIWTAVARADSGPAIAGHAVAAWSVAGSGESGDTAWAVVPAPIRLPELRIDTTVSARLVFARRDGEWVLVEVRDLAQPLLRAGLAAYLREQRATGS